MPGEGTMAPGVAEVPRPRPGHKPDYEYIQIDVEDKQPRRPRCLYLSLGILLSNAYRHFQHRRRILFVLAANMAPCWLPKSWKILVQRASERLLGGLGILQESPWRFQRDLGRLQQTFTFTLLGKGKGKR